MEGVFLDGGRYFSPTPFTDGISLSEYNHWDIMYKYFLRDSLEYIVHEFYYEPDEDDETIAHDRFEECLLIFDSLEAKKAFDDFVLMHWTEKERFSDNIHIPYMEEIEGYIMEEFKREYYNVQILRNMFGEFKRSDKWGGGNV